VASRWQRVGDLIGSGFEPHTSRTRSDYAKVKYMLKFFFFLSKIRLGMLINI